MPTKSTNNDRPLISEVNCETGEATIRPMNDVEYEAFLINQQDNETLA